MTKKYKLIKWYPSLPKEINVGYVVSIGTHPYDRYFGLIGITISPKNELYGIPKDEVENNPEFWEEVIGVKLCVSEGSVFAINLNKEYASYYYINTNKDDNNYVDLVVKASGNRYPKHVSVNEANNNLIENRWKLTKTIKSEDEETICDGESCYIVTKDFVVCKNNNLNYKDLKIFKHKENADKYVELNKPLFSKQELAEKLIEVEYYAGFSTPSASSYVKGLYNSK